MTDNRTQATKAYIHSFLNEKISVRPLPMDLQKSTPFVLKSNYSCVRERLLCHDANEMLLLVVAGFDVDESQFFELLLNFLNGIDAYAANSLLHVAVLLPLTIELIANNKRAARASRNPRAGILMLH